MKYSPCLAISLTLAIIYIFRFPDTDLLSAFGILSMRPISLLGSQELETWGNVQLEVLIEKYGQPQTHTWKEEGETMSKTTEPLINPDTTCTEWKDIKDMAGV